MTTIFDADSIASPSSAATKPAAGQASFEAQTTNASGTIPAPANVHATPKVHPPGQPLAADQSSPDAHVRGVDGTPLAPAKRSSLPKVTPPGQPLAADHGLLDAHSPLVGGNPLARDHRQPDAHRDGVADKLGGGQPAGDAHLTTAAVELLFAAEFLDDVEGVRIASENRLRSMLTHFGYEVPKKCSGKQLVALGLATRETAPYAEMTKGTQEMEHKAELVLKRVLRRHPLGPWVKATIGVGEKQGARLIAAIGEVSFNAAEDRPRRGAAELWAYCGYRPGQRRQKGVRSNWNADAKSRARVVAESCLKAKARSPYGPIYDAARVKHEHAVHEEPCAQCGTPGKPASEGSELRDGHKHARALREVAKRVLRDLFHEARRQGV